MQLSFKQFRFAATFKIVGLLLMMFSLSMLPPIVVAKIYHEYVIQPFVVSFFITIGTGFLLWLLFCRAREDIKVRDGFLVVVLFWVVLSTFGAIPFFMDPVHHLSITDSMFESVSGITTTGATVISGLQQLPHAILYYRQQLHFLGGMGIIVLAVAILPMIGVGGNLLARAETSGPVKNAKLKPRMAETAKALWGIYVGLVVLCMFCYWAAGMTFFDAICEAFSTISTGGFSIYDSSFGFYHNNAISIIGMIFMLAGATNFSLHYQLVTTGKLTGYFRNPEFRAYIIFLAVVVLVVTGALYWHDHFAHPGNDLLDAAFSIISMSTTTGLTITGIDNWPTFVPYLLVLVALIGGCAGSTAGGIKVVRVLFMRAQAKRELQQLLHPQAVIKAKLGDRPLPEGVVQSIWGFLSVFIAIYLFLMLLLLADGLSFKTVFSDLSACISNTGLGIIGDFETLPVFSKWVLIGAMLLGRLEIFTVLVLFTRDFWRK